MLASAWSPSPRGSLVTELPSTSSAPAQGLGKGGKRSPEHSCGSWAAGNHLSRALNRSPNDTPASNGQSCDPLEAQPSANMKRIIMVGIYNWNKALTLESGCTLRCRAHMCARAQKQAHTCSKPPSCTSRTQRTIHCPEAPSCLMQVASCQPGFAGLQQVGTARVPSASADSTCTGVRLWRSRRG
eukprot:scaffold113204_cov18-Tisochrysis_lutea.AAC.1